MCRQRRKRDPVFCFFFLFQRIRRLAPDGLDLEKRPFEIVALIHDETLNFESLSGCGLLIQKSVLPHIIEITKNVCIYIKKKIPFWDVL